MLQHDTSSESTSRHKTGRRCLLAGHIMKQACLSCNGGTQGSTTYSRKQIEPFPALQLDSRSPHKDTCLLSGPMGMTSTRVPLESGNSYQTRTGRGARHGPASLVTPPNVEPARLINTETQLSDGESCAMTEGRAEAL